MKLRALGTGSKFCRHPLIPASWLLVSEKDLTLIGAPWNVAPAIEKYGYDLSNLAVIIVLSPQLEQIAGLVELSSIFRHSENRPALVAPIDLLPIVKNRIEAETGSRIEDSFNLKKTSKIVIKEDYFSEVISFIPNIPRHNIPSYALKLDFSNVFISGDTKINETWLYKEATSDLILHPCSIKDSDLKSSPNLKNLSDLPLSIQSRIWLYGYEESTKEMEQPFPMMYITPGTFVFDSDRRDKLLSKERFIRENSKKQS